MPSGHVVKLGTYCRKFSDEEYERGEREVQISMMICEDDNPPAYETSSGIFTQPLYTNENSYASL